VAGVAVSLALVGLAARGDRTRVRFEAPAAPVIELSAGAHRVVGPHVARVEVRIYDLETRTPLELTSDVASEDVLTFEAPRRAVYVIDAEPRDPAGPPIEVSVVQSSTFRLSLRLLATALLAPLASMPGALALAFLRPGAGGDGGGVGLPRRLAAAAIDAVLAALLVVFLILISPLFRPIAGLIPLAPVAYAWSIAARGQGVGGWLLLVRTVRLDGSPPGAWRGLGRTLVAGAGWALAGLGYAAAALDDEGRAWHDRASGTRVIAA